MTTVVAAVIAAVAALIVVIVDRVIVARSERTNAARTLRRRIYADYLVTLQALIVWMSEDRKPAKASLPAMMDLGRRMTTCFSELELVAPPAIVDAARALSKTALHWDARATCPTDTTTSGRNL